MRAVVLFVTLLLVSVAIFPQTANGLRHVTFDTPDGKIQLRLPDDIRAGDTISGTVVSLTGAADGYTIESLGKSTRVPERRLILSIPAGVSSHTLILRNETGAEVGRTELPINPTTDSMPADLIHPVIGQAGRPLEIHGPFDGDATNTKCSIGGMLVLVVAETPRGAICELPNEPIGSTEMTIAEGGRTATSNFRMLGVQLTAPTTNLKKGESTTLKVHVRGLEGIIQNVPVNLVTTGSVNMTDGNTQRIEIKPEQVQSDGSFATTRTITGIAPGNFTVVATVLAMPQLNGKVVHVEGSPNGGGGLWQIKIMLNGKIVTIYIRSEQEPQLKYCDWIELGDVTDDNGTTYVGKYKKVPPPPKPPVKPPDTKPPDKTVKPPDGPTGKGTDETSKPPPCKEGTIIPGPVTTGDFEMMDGDSAVTFKLSTDKDRAEESAQNMAKFWRDIAELGGLKKYLPEGTGVGPEAAEWLLKYLEKGADVLDGVASGRLKRRGVNSVTVQIWITTKTIHATCTTTTVCVNGVWVTKKKLDTTEEKTLFKADKTLKKGGPGWEEVADDSSENLFDPAKADKWAKEFLKEQVNILKGNGDRYKEFLEKCK